MSDETVLTITLTLTPGPQGYKLNVGTNPADIYPDVVIEACRRAAAFFERRIQAIETTNAIQQGQQNARQFARIVGSDGRGLIT